MADPCIPYKEEASHITGKVKTTQVVSKTFVKVSGVQLGSPELGLVADGASDKSGVYQVDPCVSGDAGLIPLGVAAYDCPVGGLLTIIREGIVPVTNGAAITAGQYVEMNTAGKVIPHNTGTIIGIAMDSQSTVGGDTPILLLLQG